MELNFKGLSEISELEGSLESLAKCDSSIQYAPHIRERFDDVINRLNKLKVEMGYSCLQNKSDKYFE